MRLINLGDLVFEGNKSMGQNVELSIRMSVAHFFVKMSKWVSWMMEMVRFRKLIVAPLNLMMNIGG